MGTLYSVIIIRRCSRRQQMYAVKRSVIKRIGISNSKVPDINCTRGHSDRYRVLCNEFTENENIRQNRAVGSGSGLIESSAR